MKKKRVLIKISGEVLENKDQEANLDINNIEALANSLKKLSESNIQIGIVLGAGNIFRGRMVKDWGIDRVLADNMGMMATTINALALSSVLEKIGQKSKVLSAINIPGVIEGYSHKKAINYFEDGNIVLFTAGTGHAFFTTDTAAVLRTLEIKADSIYKATNVEGVYDSDPKKNPEAKMYNDLSYKEALEKKLKVMDSTAFALAQDNNLVLRVFKYSPDNIIEAVLKNNIGTEVK